MQIQCHEIAPERYCCSSWYISCSVLETPSSSKALMRIYCCLQEPSDMSVFHAFEDSGLSDEDFLSWRRSCQKTLQSLTTPSFACFSESLNLTAFSSARSPQSAHSSAMLLTTVPTSEQMQAAFEHGEGQSQDGLQLTESHLSL